MMYVLYLNYIYKLANGADSENYLRWSIYPELFLEKIITDIFFFFLCDESEKCIYAQERTSVRGKTDVPPQCRTRSRP